MKKFRIAIATATLFAMGDEMFVELTQKIRNFLYVEGSLD